MSIDLAPLNGARAFANAVWQDELHKRSDFTFFGIPLVELPNGFTLSCRFDLDGAKAGISLIDVEIAGQRTMVTRRFGRYGW